MGKEIIIPVIIAVVLILSLVIVLLVRGSKKKKENQELKQVAQDKKRMNNLDGYILNPNADQAELRSSAARADVVKYADNVNTITAKEIEYRNGLLLRIEEISEMSNRTYNLDPANGITIGSGPKNTISLTDTSVDKNQCEIGFATGNVKLVQIKNLGRKGKVKVQRKKETITIGEEPLRLMDGDVIRIGNEKLIVTFISMA